MRLNFVESYWTKNCWVFKVNGKMNAIYFCKVLFNAKK